jgi:selenocysteine lyase/cysteine desulfurase
MKEASIPFKSAAEYSPSENIKYNRTNLPDNQNAFKELEKSIYIALETYSNVHRGTGHYSMVSTELYEKAREIILDYLGLNKKDYHLIFCSAYGSELIQKQINARNYYILSNHDIGLPIGLRALAIKKNDLPKGIPFQTGGSVIKMVSPNSVIWADGPHKFEAGTPAVINAITYAKALMLKHQFGFDFNKKEDAKFDLKQLLYEDTLSGYSGLQLMNELRKMLIGNNILIPIENGEGKYINLDNAASAPTFTPVWETVKKAFQAPEETHSEIIKEVKKIISEFLGANLEDYNIIFTSNATEALNITSEFIKNEYKKDCVILNSLLEHNSNELPWRYIPSSSLLKLSVDNEGFINNDELENILIKYNNEYIYGSKRIRIVCLSAASNVLGSFNDLEAISTIVHKYGARLLVDGTQVTAHRGINIEKCGIDYFIFSGHKIYAPFGSGVMVLKKQYINIDKSELERIINSGEENITGIAALGKAVLLLRRIGMKNIEESETDLTSSLLKGLSEIKDIEVFGIDNPDSKRFSQKGGIVSFSMRKVPHNLAAKELAEQGGIGVRYGCFCSHLLVKHILKIHPLRAFAANMGLYLLPELTSVILPGLIRVSFGIENEKSDVTRLLEVLKKMAGSKRSILHRIPAYTHNATLFLPKNKISVQIKKFCDIRLKNVYQNNNE